MLHRQHLIAVLASASMVGLKANCRGRLLLFRFVRHLPFARGRCETWRRPEGRCWINLNMSGRWQTSALDYSNGHTASRPRVKRLVATHQPSATGHLTGGKRIDTRRSRALWLGTTKSRRPIWAVSLRVGFREPLSADRVIERGRVNWFHVAHVGSGRLIMGSFNGFTSCPK